MLPVYLIQFGYNFSLVGAVMFVPLIAQSLGASSVTIGLVVATYQGVIFLSSVVFGRLADIKGHRRFILIGLLLAAGVFFAHRYITNVPSLFVIRALAGLAIGIFPAALVAYATREKSSLGRLTASGSLGWGVGSVVAGLIAVYDRLFLLAAAIFLVSFLVALTTLTETHERLEQRMFDVTVLKRNWRVYCSFFLRHAGAMGIWAIYPLYLEKLGANRLWIGIIYAINAFGQTLFMPFLDKYRSNRLIQLGLYGSVLTFVSFALCRNFRQLLPFQVLLAFSWSCLYVGSLKYLIEHNPERSTAIGAFNSTLSFSGIIGAALGGLLASLGLPAVMLGAALMAVAGALVFHF